MKKLILLVCLLALPLHAQTAAPAEPSPEQIKQLATVMRSQRDQLSQQLLDTQSQLQMVAQELEKVKRELADLQKKSSEVKPQSK